MKERNSPLNLSYNHFWRGLIRLSCLHQWPDGVIFFGENHHFWQWLFKSHFWHHLSLESSFLATFRVITFGADDFGWARRGKSHPRVSQSSKVIRPTVRAWKHIIQILFFLFGRRSELQYLDLQIDRFSRTILWECCFVLLTWGWGISETRLPVTRGSFPKLFAFTIATECVTLFY